MTPAQTVVAAAHDCPLLARARALAAFVGTGRPVTAKAVLRRADLAAACAAAGLPDPGRVVSAAHVPALHRAWTTAQGSGLIAVGHKQACATTTTDDPLTQWRRGVAAVLRAESDDPGRRGAALVAPPLSTCSTAPPDCPTHTLPTTSTTRCADCRCRPGGRPVHVPQSSAPRKRRGRTPRRVRRHQSRNRHPHAARAVGAPRAARTPAPRITWADDDVLNLRIDLDRFRPPVWRRVRLPAATTLTELHEIIQILFEWDGDHLHVFTVDGAHYADPFYELDGCADSDQLNLAAALPRPGARLSYRYDLGDCWDHTVLLESGDPAASPTRPVCTGGRGDAPVEDWPHDEPPPPRPLDLTALDHRLAERWTRA